MKLKNVQFMNIFEFHLCRYWSQWYSFWRILEALNPPFVCLDNICISLGETVDRNISGSINSTKHCGLSVGKFVFIAWEVIGRFATISKLLKKIIKISVLQKQFSNIKTTKNRSRFLKIVMWNMNQVVQTDFWRNS